METKKQKEYEEPAEYVPMSGGDKLFMIFFCSIGLTLIIGGAGALIGAAYNAIFG